MTYDEKKIQGGPAPMPSQDFFGGKKNTQYNAGTSTIPAHTDPRLAQHMRGLQQKEAMRKEAAIQRMENTRREAPAIEESLYNEDDLG
tara:strand:- start:2081 stop:2344 length:264 start_codon:yes stop_codon:yes gene_type:complete